MIGKSILYCRHGFLMMKVAGWIIVLMVLAASGAGCARKQTIACGCHLDVGESLESVDLAAPLSVDRPASPGLLSANGTYFVIYSIATEDSEVPLNRTFSIDVKVLDGATRSVPQTNVELEVDGRMPHHRHGMNRVPRVRSLGNGEFRVDGMLFHMPGRWELYFDVKRSGRAERAMDVVWLD
jgi:hypothetical protein